MSMGQVVYILDVVLEELVNDGPNIMDEKFMMGFFNNIKILLHRSRNTLSTYMKRNY